MTITQLAANPDWQAFLVKIRAEPDDDLPRLVACDWLEDQGMDWLAVKIREQIQSGQPTESGPTPLMKSIRRRGFWEHVILRGHTWVLNGDNYISHSFACIREVTLASWPNISVRIADGTGFEAYIPPPCPRGNAVRSETVTDAMRDCVRQTWPSVEKWNFPPSLTAEMNIETGIWTQREDAVSPGDGLGAFVQSRDGIHWLPLDRIN